MESSVKIFDVYVICFCWVGFEFVSCGVGLEVRFPQWGFLGYIHSFFFYISSFFVISIHLFCYVHSSFITFIFFSVMSISFFFLLLYSFLFSETFIP